MKILVTGGAGFIGSHVAEAHVRAGDEVVIVDDLSTGKKENVPEGATLIEMDITSGDLYDLMAVQKFDVVNHHAAHMELRVSVDKPAHDAKVNVLGSIEVLEAARKTGVKHCILASTSAVYGKQTHFPADESHPILPISPYGVSKRAMELYADYYRAVHGLSITTLRYTNVYGPRQNPDGESGVIAIFLKKFLNGEQATIHGDGTQVRDYLYASDAGAANLAAAQKALNDTYMICANGEASVNDIVKHLMNAVPGECSVVNGPAKAGDPPRTRGSYDKFHNATKWKPAVNLEDGIKKTVASFTNR